MTSFIHSDMRGYMKYRISQQRSFHRLMHKNCIALSKTIKSGRKSASSFLFLTVDQILSAENIYYQITEC